MSDLSEFEVCKRIRARVLMQAGEAIVYTNWSDEFAIQELRQVVPRAKTTVDVSGFTKTEFDELGFGTWDKETGLRLIPLWLFPFISDEVEYTAIDGDKIKGRDQMDNDHRGGFLAFGILP